MMMMMMKEKSNKMQQCIRSFIIPYLYEAQHVSGDTPPIIRSLKLHWQSLVFHTQCSWQRPPTPCSTNFHKWKTRGCQCSFRLLMIGSVSPETRWASYKYAIIKFWYIVASCWIFLYKLYYDARIHEYQTYSWYSYNGQWNAITDNKPSGHIMKYINPYPANVENMVSSY